MYTYIHTYIHQGLTLPIWILQIEQQLERLVPIAKAELISVLLEAPLGDDHAKKVPYLKDKKICIYCMYSQTVYNTKSIYLYRVTPCYFYVYTYSKAELISVLLEAPLGDDHAKKGALSNRIFYP